MDDQEIAAVPLQYDEESGLGLMPHQAGVWLRPVVEGLQALGREARVGTRIRRQIEVRRGEIRVHVWEEAQTELMDEDGDPIWHRKYRGHLRVRVNTQELQRALDFLARSDAS